MSAGERVDESALVGDAKPQPDLPPLRLHHFFAVTTACSVMLGLLAALRVPVAAAEVPWLIDGSLAVTVLIFGLAWRRVGIPFFNLPGHWLLLGQTASAALHLMIVCTALPARYSLPFHGWIALTGVVFSLLLAAIAILGALHCKADKVWRWYFIVTAIICIWWVLWTLGSPSYTPSGTFSLILLLCLPNVILLALILPAVFFDVGKRRHWSHWAGTLGELSIRILAVGMAVHFILQHR